jgi:hypothetical protein
VLNANENIQEKEEFIFIFKNVWADNADFCAKQYTGTGALKTDFTRCWFVSTYVTPYLFRMFDVCTFMLLDGGCMYHAYL